MWQFRSLQLIPYASIEVYIYFASLFRLPYKGAVFDHANSLSLHTNTWQGYSTLTDYLAGLNWQI